MNILIADAGSTKTDWALPDTTTGKHRLMQSEGINALLASEGMLHAVMKDVTAGIGTDTRVDAVCYYGAGCATESACRRVEKVLREATGADSVEVYGDLLGAARSLCGRKPGVACILGTGSNSCLYDGSGIRANTPPLGFILGDEGSGTAFGKRLLSDAFKGGMPEEVRERFMERFGLTLADVVENVYRSERPGKYIAQFARFVGENIEEPYIREMVKEEFRRFFHRNLSRYEGIRHLPVNFTGSIAHHLSALLREAAESEGYRIGRITKSPMEGLLEYHLDRN